MTPSQYDFLAFIGLIITGFVWGINPVVLSIINLSKVLSSQMKAISAISMITVSKLASFAFIVCQTRFSFLIRSVLRYYAEQRTKHHCRNHICPTVEKTRYSCNRFAAIWPLRLCPLAFSYFQRLTTCKIFKSYFIF